MDTEKLRRIGTVVGIIGIATGISITTAILAVRGSIVYQRAQAGVISKVTCYGDSLTAGDNDTTMCYEFWLQQALPNVTVINRGVGGTLSKWIVDGTQPVGALKEGMEGITVPVDGVAILLCGTNDLNVGHPEWILPSIISAIWKCGGRLLVITLPPHPKFPLETIQSINAQIRILCDCLGVPTCSLDNMLPEHFRDDNLHFTAAGYEHVGKAVAASLRLSWQMA